MKGLRDAAIAPRSRRGAVAWVRDNPVVTGLLAVYVASAALVPILAPVAVSDDPIHARSVEILLDEHTIRILPVAVSTLVAQIAWGALFQTVFGHTLGVLRVSTFVVTVAGAVMFVLGLFVSLYPNVMPDLGGVHDLTAEAAASSPYTLKVMTVVAAIMTPVVVAYQAWTYWVFRKRISRRSIPADRPKNSVPPEADLVADRG